MVDPFFVDKNFRGRPVGANAEFEQQMVGCPPADANEPTVVEQLQVMRVAKEREIPFIVGASV